MKQWHEIESMEDYIQFFTDRGYRLNSETVRDGVPPAAVSKVCEMGHNNYRRLTPADPEVLQFRAREAEEKDCGHPASRHLRVADSDSD